MRISNFFNISNFLVSNKMAADFIQTERADVSTIAKTKSVLNEFALMFVWNKTAKRAAIFEQYLALRDVKAPPTRPAEVETNPENIIQPFRILTQNEIFSILSKGISIGEINSYKENCTQDGFTYAKIIPAKKKQHAENALYRYHQKPFIGKVVENIKSTVDTVAQFAGNAFSKTNSCTSSAINSTCSSVANGWNTVRSKVSGRAARATSENLQDLAPSSDDEMIRMFQQIISELERE